MHESKIQSILRQIEETKYDINFLKKKLEEADEKVEAFELLLKDTIEKESTINLTESEF